MKLIHLSDLHVGHWNNGEAFEKIVAFLETDATFDDDQHAVVMTGDLIHDAGTDNPFDEFKIMLGRLSARFEGRVFLCPGNHDYGNFWGGHEDFIRDFHNEFEPYLRGTGDIPADDYLPDGMPYGSPFPVVSVFDRVVLIGLDSTADELVGEGFDLGAEGRIGERQLRALDALLSHPVAAGKKIVVYLHHHPYESLHYFNRLKDADRFTEVMKNRVNVVLFGHNHRFANCSSNSQQDGIGLALDGGKSTSEMRFRILYDLDAFRYREVFLP